MLCFAPLDLVRLHYRERSARHSKWFVVVLAAIVLLGAGCGHRAAPPTSSEASSRAQPPSQLSHSSQTGERLETLNAGSSVEQAVIVYLDGIGLPDEIYDQYDLATLEDQLTNVLEAGGTGEYDGNEFGPTEVELYMYGPNAEALFMAIEPVLRAYPLCRNARVLIRPGGPGVQGRELRLTGSNP